MAAEILSQDIIAICLVLSEGNLTMSLGELIERVEQYQERQDRHFGLSRQDFRGLFRNWLCDLGLAKLDDFSPLAPRCPIPLQRLLSRILEFHSAWFNDEGEYWNQEPSWGTRAVIGLGYGGGGAPPPRSGPWVQAPRCSMRRNYATLPSSIDCNGCSTRATRPSAPAPSIPVSSSALASRRRSCSVAAGLAHPVSPIHPRPIVLPFLTSDGVPRRTSTSPRANASVTANIPGP